jgi:broad-specificity NMP kinase
MKYSTNSKIVEYLKNNGLEQKTKIFILSDNYRDLKNELLARGWHENEDSESLAFHLMFMVKQKSI